MTQTSSILSLNAADLAFVDRAAGILMDLLHCDEDEAVALLRAQSLAADTGIDVVARAFVVAA